MKENYGPGADTGRVPLVHNGEEGGTVISGRLKVTVDGERRSLVPAMPIISRVAARIDSAASGTSPARSSVAARRRRFEAAGATAMRIAFGR